jgi:hypothetical protein
MNAAQIITGEKVQQYANVYLGDKDDLYWNPVIGAQKDKHVYIDRMILLNQEYNNPRIIFCYSHKIEKLASILHLFLNPFILITHNSDENIRETPTTKKILDCEKVDKWYSQNVGFFHPKLFMVPIGLANSMWPHGNLQLFENTTFMSKLGNKTRRTFFNFNIHTNRTLRESCYNSLRNSLDFLPNIDPTENLKRLSNYEFCICPEGNGADCHRIWEALYLKVVPIMVKSAFTETLMRNNIPIVVLNSWDEYPGIEPQLKYEDYSFDIIERNYSMDNFMQKMIEDL